MSTGDVFYAPYAPTRATSTTPSTQPAYRLWLAVVLAHGFMLFLAGLNHPPPLTAPSVTPIQARLVPAPPVTPQATPVPAPPPGATSAAGLYAPHQSAPAKQDTAILQNAASSAKKATSAAEANAPAAPPVRFDPRAARQVIEQQHQHALQDLAQEHARARRNPVITDPRKGQPEAFSPPAAKKIVRCDNALNEVVAALSRAAGGTLRCSQPPDIDAFIERRRSH